MRIVYIGQKGDSLSDVPERDPNIDEVRGVSAGKFRRYHSEGLKQFLDLKTMYLNIRDIFRVLAGLYQSWRLLKRVKPEIIFIKGGFVGVPVGLAAAWLHIPFITHDSDAIPGLANRIVSRWAVKHAVALPAEVYAYDKSKTVTVGVPVVADYKFVSPTMQANYKHELKLPKTSKLLFVIGGGLGAQRLNTALLAHLPKLLHDFPDLHVVHGVGRANEDAMHIAYAKQLDMDQMARVQVIGFLHDVYRYSGAADVVVTRAGATNLAEFAVQGKACVVVPSPFLTGGHQLKNARYLQEQQAIEVLDETDLESELGNVVADLLNDPAKQTALGKRFTAFGNVEAAHDLAQLLLDEVQKA